MPFSPTRIMDSSWSDWSAMGTAQGERLPGRMRRQFRGGRRARDEHKEAAAGPVPALAAAGFTTFERLSAFARNQASCKWAQYGEDSRPNRCPGSYRYCTQSLLDARGVAP